MNTVEVMLKPIRDEWAIDPADGREIARLPRLCAKPRTRGYMAADNRATEASDAR
jgi:hypothetical protein